MSLYLRARHGKPMHPGGRRLNPVGTGLFISTLCLVMLAACGDRLTLIGDGAFVSVVSQGSLLDNNDVEELRTNTGLVLETIDLGEDISAEGVAAALEAAGDGWIAVPAALKPFLPSGEAGGMTPRVAVLYDRGEPAPGTISVQVARENAYREAGEEAFAFISRFDEPLRLAVVLREPDRPLGDILVDSFLEAGGAPSAVRSRYIRDDSPREQLRSAMADLAGTETGVMVLSAGAETGYAMELVTREGNPVIVESPPVPDAYADQVLGFIHAPLVDLLSAFPEAARSGVARVEVDAVYVEGTAVF